MISVDKVSKRFGQVQALDGISFTAEAGSITALLGPNGAGKSTCLRTLYGLLKPDHGQVSIGGLAVASSPQAARGRLGIVTDDFGLYERLNPRDHLRYFGKLHGMRGSALERAIDAVLGDLGLEQVAERACKGFSAGQRIKVALARALLHHPDVLILDEPTRGLDVMSTRAVRDALLRARARGAAVLLSTHVMQEAAAICDRVVIMAAGRVRYAGDLPTLARQTGSAQLEQAFINVIGSDEGIAA